jgi:heme a synthase
VQQQAIWKNSLARPNKDDYYQLVVLEICIGEERLDKSIRRKSVLATTISSTLSKLVKHGHPMITCSKKNMYATTGKWILGTGGLVVAMVNIGGITRLTQSGLSMTDWSIGGGLPPLTTAEWNVEFERYKQYPEWQQRKDMTLNEFQYIYAWEYGHRMFGRFIGIAFIMPWMYFTIRKRIPPSYQPRMVLLGSMGLTQGLIGWWMVKSGLGDERRSDTKEIRVTPTRLATHLSMAVATYGALLWTGMDILKLPHTTTTTTTSTTVLTATSGSLNNTSLLETIINEITTAAEKVSADKVKLTSSLVQDAFNNTCRLRYAAIGLTGLTGVTIASGAFVAGNDAGRAYNTFPKMHDDYWIPPTEELLELQPLYRNFIDNTATVQLNHRILGSTVAFSTIGVSAIGLSNSKLASTVADVASSASLMSVLSRSGTSVSNGSNGNGMKFLLTPQVRNGLWFISIAAIEQVTLGITTLLTYVPISLAALH